MKWNVNYEVKEIASAQTMYQIIYFKMDIIFFYIKQKSYETIVVVNDTDRIEG